MRWGVELNFNKSGGISILSPKGLQAEFKAKTSVSFIGYRYRLWPYQFQARDAKEFAGLVVVPRLLEPPPGAEEGAAQNRIGDVDWDYVIMLAQVRRYLYGELSELQLRKYMALSDSSAPLPRINELLPGRK